jgi:hypothetical protein
MMADHDDEERAMRSSLAAASWSGEQRWDLWLDFLSEEERALRHDPISEEGQQSVDTIPRESTDPVLAKSQRWATWEATNEQRRDEQGLDYYSGDDRPTWERPDRACLHCDRAPAAYTSGACRTCYRWLARNRGKYPADQLEAELRHRIARRRRG